MKEKQIFSFEGIKDGGRMHVRVLDVQTGLKEYSEVYAVRMLDEGVHRLFMNDYIPTLGQVRGDVIVLNREGEYAYPNISGFYKLQHNELTLLIEEHLDEKAVEA